MESKIKNFLENDNGFMDYMRKRTRSTASEVYDSTAESNGPNSMVSESFNTTQDILNDTVEKLMLFGDYCMDPISNTRIDNEGKEIVVLSPRESKPNHSSDHQMTECEYTPESKMDDWSEAELDALWIAVRKYGEGNWNAILEDPSVPLLRHKTLEELTTRWAKEAAKIFPPTEPIPIRTVLSNGTTTMPFPSQGTASRASDFSFLKLLADVQNESLKMKHSDMNKRFGESGTMHNGKQEMVAIVKKKKSAGNDDAGSSMKNPIEIDD